MIIIWWNFLHERLQMMVSKTWDLGGNDRVTEFITGLPGCIMSEKWNFGFFGLTDFSPSASLLKSKFSFINLLIAPFTKLLSCSVESSCDDIQLLLSNIWQLASLVYFSVVTKAPPLSALVITISFLFASSSIVFSSLLNRLGFAFLRGFFLRLDYFVLNQ